MLQGKPWRLLQAAIVVLLPVGLYLLGLAGVDALASKASLTVVAILAAVLAVSDHAPLPAIGATAVGGGFVVIEYSTGIGIVLAGGGGFIFFIGALRHVGLRFRSTIAT